MEAWPTKNCRFFPTIPELSIPGYNTFSSGNNSGRGICIYIKDNINAAEVLLDQDFAEQLSVEIKLRKGDSLLISTIYRSPNSSDLNNIELSNILQTINDHHSSHKLIVGDFNFPAINWSTMSTNDPAAQRFLNCVNGQYWTQHINQATIQCGADRTSLLDLIFTNEEGMVDQIKFNSPLGKSDHLLIGFKFNCYLERINQSFHKYYYNKGDYQLLRQKLAIDWHHLLDPHMDNVDEQWKIFREVYDEAHSTCIPHKQIKLKQSPWQVPMDEAVVKKIKQKNRSWTRYMETRSQEKLQEYKRFRNQTRNLVRRAKKNFEKDVATTVKKSPKKFWKYVNNRTKVKSTIPDLVTENGTATTDKVKADYLNNFFSSVFTEEPAGQLPQFPSRTPVTLSNIPLTPDRIKKKLQTIKTESSPGPDKVHPRLLKEAAEELAVPLRMIFMSSLNQGRIPEDWKSAEVCAIHKKGSKSSCNNYRPVSLTSVVCKTLESLIRENIMEHLKSHKLLSNKQYGFISGRSTTLQLLQVLDQWTLAMDQGLPIEAVYMDFQKAFDSVPHARMIHKLAGYGISDSLLRWLEDFLYNRKQGVRVCNSYSSFTEVKSGIPQGSVLGPVMFVLYINDLPDNIQNIVYMFADDTKIFSIGNLPSTAEEDSLQKDLIKLQEWSDTWLLKFHPEKCKRLFVSRSTQDSRIIPLTLKGPGGQGTIAIEDSTQEKDLGILMDNRIKFDIHIGKISKRGNSIMGIIRRTFDHLDHHSFKPLFTSLVRPILEYGQNVWSPYLQGDIDKLENVQRRATRQVNGLKGLTYPERLRKLQLPSLKFRRLRGDAIETYKLIQNIYDEEVTMSFPRAPRTSRGHSLKLYQERSRLDIRKHYFRNRIIKTWNSLPEHVISAPSLNSFKNRIDKYWENHPMKFNPYA